MNFITFERFTLTRNNIAIVAEQLGGLILADPFHASRAHGKIVNLEVPNGPKYLLHVSIEETAGLFIEHIGEPALQGFAIPYGSAILIDDECRRIQLYINAEKSEAMTYAYAPAVK